MRPFRFGSYLPALQSREELSTFAQMVESQGYSTLAVGEHPGFGVSGPLAMLAAAAMATTTLRLTAHVFNNDLRHPAMFAGDLAFIDAISGGRLDIGIGAGWYRTDYQQLGIPFDRASVRIKRLEEAIYLIKQLFTGEPVTFSGTHYQVQDLRLSLTSIQRPHPPFFIGGGGRRLLTIAAREAQIIGLDPKGTPEGAKDDATSTGTAYDEKIRLMRELAGERFSELEFHVLSIGNKVTDDRRQVAQEIAEWFNSFPSDIVINNLWDAHTILDTPQTMIGTVDQICDDLRERRERYGISYISVPAEHAEMFAPVVERLTGT